jgi:hypothetical protein
LILDIYARHRWLRHGSRVGIIILVYVSHTHTHTPTPTKLNACAQFIYQGCGGNANRFPDPGTCVDACTQMAPLTGICPGGLLVEMIQGQNNPRLCNLNYPSECGLGASCMLSTSLYRPVCCQVSSTKPLAINNLFNSTGNAALFIRSRNASNCRHIPAVHLHGCSALSRRIIMHAECECCQCQCVLC